MNKDENLIPLNPVIQYHEFKCYQCGYPNRFLKPNEMIDYRSLVKDYRIKLRDIIHHINSLMSFCEKNYGMNPQKEKIIEELLKIRDLYED